MYRILILVAAFLFAIAGLLFLQGGDRDPRDLASVIPEFDDGTATPVANIQDASAPANPAPTTAPELDLSALTAAVSASVEPTPAPAPNNEIAAMTSGVLADLGIQANTPEGAAMQDITAAVLASLNGATTQTGGQKPGQMDLQALIAQSMQSGQGNDYIDALLNEAVTTGKVQVPDGLQTSDGRLDTRTLLATIVNQSMGDTGGANIAALKAEAGAGTRVAAPQVQSSGNQRFYTVESGDSLAYISLLFYQDSSQYDRIFEANRDKLASPNQIRVGQRLLIPG